MTQQMNNRLPDYVVIKTAPNVDIGDMAGEWIDRNKTQFLEVAIQLHGCKMVPTPDLEFSAQGEVAQVWIIEREH